MLKYYKSGDRKHLPKGRYKTDGDRRFGSVTCVHHSQKLVDKSESSYPPCGNEVVITDRLSMVQKISELIGQKNDLKSLQSLTIGQQLYLFNLLSHPDNKRFRFMTHYPDILASITIDLKHPMSPLHFFHGPRQSRTDYERGKFYEYHPGIFDSVVLEGNHFTVSSIHREAALVNSYNYLFEGDAKIWFVVSSRRTEEFKHYMKLRFPDLEGKKSNFYSLYKRLYFFIPTPTEIHDFDITVIHQQKNEAVLTNHNCYHWIINLGPNLAEAVNWLYESPSWQSALQHELKCLTEMRRSEKDEVDEITVSQSEQTTKTTTKRTTKSGKGRKRKPQTELYKAITKAHKVDISIAWHYTSKVVGDE